jgi:hypothetical protein
MINMVIVALDSNIFDCNTVMMIRLTLLYVFIMVSLCVLPPLNKPSVLINPSNQYELATYTFSFTL